MSDQDLHHLLHDAVEDVHPEHGPDAIRARASRSTRSGSRVGARRWAPLVVAAAAAVVLVIGGTAWLTARINDQQPAAAPTRPAPTGAPTPTTGTSPSVEVSTTSAPTHTAEVSVFYVGPAARGAALFSERHTLDGVTGSDIDAAVREALTGPPRDTDYVPFPAGDASRLTVTTSQDASALTVDLQHWQQPAASDLPSIAEQRMALQAVVWTADTATGTTLPVRFLVDGQPVASLLSTDTSQPVAPLPADTALSPVSITSPAEGATVSSPFTVTGSASDAEADVVWELDQVGRVVRHGFTTAQQCCTLSPYSFTVSAPPGTYTLVVHDTDVSNGEGKGITRDTKTVTVR